MDDLLARFWDNVVGRLTGPMSFRIPIQFTVALLFGIRDGLADAHRGAPFFFLSLLTEPSQRPALLRDMWKSVGKVFVVALAVDVIYQIIVLHFIYPFEALFVAFLLALVPYIVIRGPTNRISRAMFFRHHP